MNSQYIRYTYTRTYNDFCDTLGKYNEALAKLNDCLNVNDLSPALTKVKTLSKDLLNKFNVIQNTAQKWKVQISELDDDDKKAAIDERKTYYGSDVVKNAQDEEIPKDPGDMDVFFSNMFLCYDVDKVVQNVYEARLHELKHPNTQQRQNLVTSLMDNSSSTPSNEDANSESECIPLARLPPMELVKFNGNDWEWSSFWERYNEMIHCRRISNVEKFAYLVSYLKDEPLNLVRMLPQTGNNYDSAIEILQSHYNNPIALKQSILNQLESIKPRSMNPRDQQRALTQIRSLITQLSHSEDVDSSFLMKMVREKFSLDITKRICRVFGRDSYSMTELLNCIDDGIGEASLVESMTSNFSLSSENHTRSNNSFQKKPSLSPRSAQDVTSANEKLCVYCKKTHFSHDCQTVKTIDARRSSLKEKSLCYVCLKNYHGDCSEKCELCSGSHHRSICQGQRKVGFHNTQVESESLIINGKNVANTRFMMANVTLKNPHNDRSVTVKAFFDTGSSSTLISEKTVKALGVSHEGEHRLTFTGVQNLQVPVRTYLRVNIQAQGCDGPHSFKAFVVPNGELGTMNLGSINKDDQNALKSLFPSWAEQESENQSFSPQILFGIGDCHRFVKEQYNLPSGYVANNSVFGPIVSGGSMFGIQKDDDNDDDAHGTDELNEQMNQQLMCCFGVTAEMTNGHSKLIDPHDNDDANMIMNAFSENQYIMGLFSHSSDPPDFSFI